MNAQVFILSGPRQGQTLTILDPPFLVGNTPEDDFYVDPVATPEAAGRKLRFDWHEEGWELLNLGGGEVMVNQEVVDKRHRLRSGDVIRISSAGPELSFTLGATEKSPLPEAASSLPAASAVGTEVQADVDNTWWMRNRSLTAFLVLLIACVIGLMMLDKEPALSAVEIAEIADQSVREGEALTLDVALGVIPEGVSVSYSLEPNIPEGMTIQPSSGVITWTPTEEDGGKVQSVTVVYELTNASGKKQQREGFVVKVVEVDGPPRILPISDYELDFDGDGVVRLAVDAFDPDTPANDLSYSVVDFQVEGETVERPSGFKFQQETGRLVWRPSREEFAKVYTVRVKVEEVSQGGLSSESSFQIRLPAAAVSEAAVAYLLTIEDKEGANRFAVGAACAVRKDVLLTSGEVANLLQQRKAAGWKIVAQQALSGKTQQYPIKEILVHKLFNELQGDESKQIFYDFGLLRVDSQERPIAEMATIEDWAEAAPGMPLECLAIPQSVGEPLTRFDDPTAALYPAKVMAVSPFSTDPKNPLSGSTVLLQVTGTLPEGCVGSPVLNKEGRVLGIYAEKAEIPVEHPLAGKLKNRLHYAAPGHYVTAWLKGLNQADWTTPKMKPVEASQENE